MKKLTFIVAFLLSFSGFSQGVLTSAEIKGAILTITPSNMQSRSAGNLPIQSLKVKRLRLDTLLKVASEGITMGVSNKADLSYVNTQLAGKPSIAQVNTIVSPKMDSVRVKSLLTLKADLTALNSKVETSTFNSALATKANNMDLALKANTADVNALLNFKAPTLNPTFTGTVSGITPTMVGLGNVSNTSDENKPVSIAQAAINASLQTSTNTKLTFLISASFSAIPVQSGANYKLILVLADETNANNPTLYFYDGAGLNWLPILKLY